MTDTRCDHAPIQEALEGSEEITGTSSSKTFCAEHGETSDSLPGSVGEFIRDRFSTKLEDPRTGRKAVYPAG